MPIAGFSEVSMSLLVMLTITCPTHFNRKELNQRVQPKLLSACARLIRYRAAKDFVEQVSSADRRAVDATVSLDVDTKHRHGENQNPLGISKHKTLQ